MSQEQLESMKGGDPFYCVQEVTIEAIEAGTSDTFYCYDTMDELSEKYNEMEPAIDMFFEANRQRGAVGHWAVYAHVLYSGLIADIYGCWDSVPNSSIYSLTHWDTPLFSLAAYYGANYTGSGIVYTLPNSADGLSTPYWSARPYNVGCA